MSLRNMLLDLIQRLQQRRININFKKNDLKIFLMPLPKFMNYVNILISWVE